MNANPVHLKKKKGYFILNANGNSPLNQDVSAVSSMLYSSIGSCCVDQNKLWNGKYQIKKQIGKGSYGIVFLARDIFGTLKNKVAIKVLG